MAVVTGRKTALDAIKGWLEGIATDGGYQSDVVEVRRGIYFEHDFAARPALCLFSYRGPTSMRIHGAAGAADRTLHCKVWGYVDVQPGDYDNLDALISDVESCLMRNIDNWAGAGILKIDIGDSMYWEGGPQDPIGVFEMEIAPVYRYTPTSP